MDMEKRINYIEKTLKGPARTKSKTMELKFKRNIHIDAGYH